MKVERCEKSTVFKSPEFGSERGIDSVEKSEGQWRQTDGVERASFDSVRFRFYSDLVRFGSIRLDLISIRLIVTRSEKRPDFRLKTSRCESKLSPISLSETL